MKPIMKVKWECRGNTRAPSSAIEKSRRGFIVETEAGIPRRRAGGCAAASMFGYATIVR
jgi:hypothetical protein